MKRSTWILIALAAMLTSACTRVGPGYVGIKVSLAGDTKGVDNVPAATGWVFYNPIFSSVYEYPTFVQTAVWTLNPNEGDSNCDKCNEEITFTNADKMQVSADISLSYHLVAERVPAFYVKFRSDDLKLFTHGFLRNLARDTFNEHAGKYSIGQIMGDNAAFIKDVRDSLQELLVPLGVQLDQFGLIGAPRPPQAVIEQINASVHATQLATQKQNELVQVEADNAKERIKTDTWARNTLVAAEAQATSNRKLADSITPNLLELKRLEKWNGVLPTVSGGSTPFISLPAAK